jgi:hypothetical protein
MSKILIRIRFAFIVLIGWFMACSSIKGNNRLEVDVIKKSH